MKLPRSLVINGDRWRVLQKDLSNKDYVGLCVHRRCEIQVDSNLTGEEKLETFLHEVLHACLREPFAERTEERMVLRLAPRLLAALKDIGWVP